MDQKGFERSWWQSYPCLHWGNESQGQKLSQWIANYQGAVWAGASNRLQYTRSIVTSDCTSAQILPHSQIESSPETTEADDTARAEMLWIIESQALLLKDNNLDIWKKQLGLLIMVSGGVEVGLGMPMSPIQRSSLYFSTRITTWRSCLYLMRIRGCSTME